MAKRALLFPGQGAQYPGMGKEFYDGYKEVRHRFEEAEDLLKRPLRKECFEGPEPILKVTEVAQPALFTLGAALFDLFCAQHPGIAFDYALGLSLGEYTALYALGALSFQEGLSLVALRGRLMTEACRTNKGSMAAVLGLGRSAVETIVEEANMPNDLWVANLNSPAQIVISGTERGLKEAAFLLQEGGAKKVISLEVEGAFHSGLMKSVEAPLKSAIYATKWNKIGLPLVMNLTAKSTTNLDEIKEGLVYQVSHPVRWHDSIETIQKEGVLECIEFGPGKSLSALNKRISPTLITKSCEKPSDLEQFS